MSMDPTTRFNHRLVWLHVALVALIPLGLALRQNRHTSEITHPEWLLQSTYTTWVEHLVGMAGLAALLAMVGLLGSSAWIGFRAWWGKEPNPNTTLARSWGLPVFLGALAVALFSLHEIQQALFSGYWGPARGYVQWGQFTADWLGLGLYLGVILPVYRRGLRSLNQAQAADGCCRFLAR